MTGVTYADLNWLPHTSSLEEQVEAERIWVVSRDVSLKKESSPMWRRAFALPSAQDATIKDLGVVLQRLHEAYHRSLPATLPGRSELVIRTEQLVKLVVVLGEQLDMLELLFGEADSQSTQLVVPSRSVYVFDLDRKELASFACLSNIHQTNSPARSRFPTSLLD